MRCERTGTRTSYERRMMRQLLSLLTLLICGVGATVAHGEELAPAPSAAARGMRYEANWESLDRRRNPAWFDDEKIGIFIHWSVFSVPAIAWVYPDKPYGFGGHSCWYGMYIDRLSPVPSRTGQAGGVPPQDLWRCSVQGPGAAVQGRGIRPASMGGAVQAIRRRYAFLTSNFHDGYCLWPSPYSPGWNSVDVGPKRDLLGDFCLAMRAGRAAGRFLLFARRVQSSALSGGEEAGGT